jgi:hypothetical protein
MGKKPGIHFAGLICIAPGDLPQALETDLRVCGQPGPAEEAVEYIMAEYEITGDIDSCRKWLRAYGAWDEAQLSDHDTNLQRLVWLTGCGLCEGETVYFG